MVSSSLNQNQLIYPELVKFLDGRSEKKIAHNTTARLEREFERDANGNYQEVAPNAVSIVLHGSPIVRYNADGSIVLNAHGWYSHTTKQRMNQFTPHVIGVSIGVFQKNSRWYVRVSDKYQYASLHTVRMDWGEVTVFNLQSTAKTLQDYDVATDIQDIQAIQDSVGGMWSTDVTAMLTRQNEGEFTEVWATRDNRPYDIDAVFTRII